jgi:hypothetical protein
VSLTGRFQRHANGANYCFSDAEWPTSHQKDRMWTTISTFAGSTVRDIASSIDERTGSKLDGIRMATRYERRRVSKIPRGAEQRAHHPLDLISNSSIIVSKIAPCSTRELLTNIIHRRVASVVIRKITAALASEAKEMPNLALCGHCRRG